jgi:hypothetical protein
VRRAAEESPTLTAKHGQQAVQLEARGNGPVRASKAYASPRHQDHWPIDREKQLAIEARRAAEKSLTFAAKHGPQAVQLEVAAELAARKNNYAMTHKWPAMIHGPIDREKRLAIEARRAAEESLTFAAKHGPQAVQLEARGNRTRQGP